MISSDVILGLPHYQITGIQRNGKEVRISARYTGPISCPDCGHQKLRKKDRFRRQVRHQSLCGRRCLLELEGFKWCCLGCGRYFRQRFTGVQLYQRSTDAYQRWIFRQHRDGISRSRLGQREAIGAATVERYFQRQLDRQLRGRRSGGCPQVLGIDEHFFTRREGFATTFCDLKNRKVYDVVLGRSQKALEAYFQGLEGKDGVKLVCIDLSVTYRAIVRQHLPNALIVADRFHVIRLVNHHFLACWREIDPVGSKNRGLISLMRRHSHNLKPDQEIKLRAYLQQQPVLELLYRFKQFLCRLLLHSSCNQNKCARLAPRLLRAIDQLRQTGLAQLVTLGETLDAWKEEIARMWRFSRTNGITEGFHNKMETLTRQAYGFRNFNNYRRRVRVLCS